jgi:hypothetical protein
MQVEAIAIGPSEALAPVRSVCAEAADILTDGTIAVGDLIVL